ncbi:tRNA pseudouridine synthase B [Candidatus Calditenuaceae archaeon HR02]|nr:tRNA pseudouridine synthase B [Candidatus Calditenuaceae archaeon HR02]
MGGGDPAVSGLLPILLGRATKASEEIHTYPKEYICLLRLHEEVDDHALEWGLSQFVGEFYQTPPVRSNVARQVRKKELFEAEVLERDGRDILLRMIVSGGTYVRKLCHDLGLVLGVGAHMVELRRVRVGPKSERGAVTIQQLQRAVWQYRESRDEKGLRSIIRPIEELLEYIPRIIILDSAVDAICHGAHLARPGIAQVETRITPGATVGIFTLKGEIVAIARALKSTEGMLREGGIIAKTDRVLMTRGTYPPKWGKGKSKTSWHTTY